MTASNDNPRALDLGLFRLPIGSDPDNAEVGIGDRSGQLTAKRRFWRRIARTMDITGRGSLVRTRPYGQDHDQVLDGFSQRVEYLHGRAKRYEDANVLMGDGKTRELGMHQKVSSQLEEVTPQFFLRNIARLERDVNVRRPSYRDAIWREPFEDDLERARNPQIDAFEGIDKLSAAVMMELKAENFERVLGFPWDTDLPEVRARGRRPPFFGRKERERISVWDISADPAPPNRALSAETTQGILDKLGARFDATRKPRDKD